MPVGTTFGAILVGVTVKVSPEQIVCTTSAMLGSGFTVIAMVNVSVQLFGAVPKLAVTVYVTTILFEVLLLKVWLMLVCADA